MRLLPDFPCRRLTASHLARCVLLGAAAGLLAACATTVAPGPTLKQSSDAGTTELTNQPPGALGIREEGLNWVATGAANVKAVRVNGDGVLQLGSGPATRQVYWNPATSAFILSSETDLEVDHATAYGPDGKPTYEVSGFRTLASTPTTALEAALREWGEQVKVWAPAERDAVVEKLRQQADVIKSTAPTAADALVRLAGIIAGV